MHSSLVRVQQVFGFLTTVSFVMGLMTALSVLIFPTNPVASVDVKNINVVKGRSQTYYSSRQNEYAMIKFDLDADLESLFNWNTKQIFVYITATYPGDRYVENEAVIWDKIIGNKEDSVIKSKDVRSKYNIHDITGKFDERNATLAFWWNVQPHIGALLWGGQGTKRFEFPGVGAKAKAT